MTVPNDVKLPLLRSFHEKLYEPGWTFNGSGEQEKDRQVLVQFDVIQKEFALLDESYQRVIADITKKMGAGMADYAALATPERPVAEVNSIDDYDLYCHYVAGLVGEGLSGLFATSGKEREFLANQLTLSNSMGALLQKTNIYRDIKEDVDEGRGFWPRAIWGKYGFNSMNELVDPARRREAQWAANEMVLDALRHATDALDYLTLLKNQTVFNFVAIPAVMAMATLECCFMNPAIFERNVKIRKGQAVQIVMSASNPRDVAFMFRDYAKAIHAKVPKDEPNMLRFSIACARIEQWAEHHYPSFIIIQPGAGGKGASAGIDPMSTDARIGIYNDIAQKSREKAEAKRREEIMEDLRARGLIKPTDPNSPAMEKWKETVKKSEASENDPFPYLLLAGIVIGIIVVFGLTILGALWALGKWGHKVSYSSTCAETDAISSMP